MDVASSTGEDTVHDFLAALAAAADIVSWYCGTLLLLVILVGTLRGGQVAPEEAAGVAARGGGLSRRACDEVYVVGEGETLHGISDRCGDPSIVERNPHIQDPDDVFPGQVIRIVPSNKEA